MLTDIAPDRHHDARRKAVVRFLGRARSRCETIARGLSMPWALAFLPDGRMLVTERPGRMRIVTRDGKMSPPLKGVPEVWASGQGGLLDVALDRISRGTRRSISATPNAPAAADAPRWRARSSTTATAASTTSRIIFRQEGPLSSGNHYGCRIAQAADGNLFVSLGDHFGPRDEAQNLGNHLGKIIRITPDGAVPPDNPFVGRAGAKPEIWSYGHRNPQSLAINPATGKLWEIEHGPRGGDEVNIVGKGKNYGWPVIGYGIDYSGAKIHDSTPKDGMEQPVKYWVPSIAPSGMAFYTGELFPKWSRQPVHRRADRHDAGAADARRRKGDGEERLLQKLNERIRDVRQGPDGALWLLTDSTARPHLAGRAGREVMRSVRLRASRPFVENQKRAERDGG